MCTCRHCQADELQVQTALRRPHTQSVGSTVRPMMCVGALVLTVVCWGAASALPPLPPLPSYNTPGCVFRGTEHAVGEKWVTGPPDKCAKYLCQAEGQFVALTCPWFIPAPGCFAVPGDEEAVYPGCCPQRKCHQDSDDAVEDVEDAEDGEAATTSTVPTAQSWTPELTGTTGRPWGGPTSTGRVGGDEDEALTPTMATWTTTPVAIV